MSDHRDDDTIGRGYCPRCFRSMSVDTALFGYCPEHGRVPADFTRPLGWVDPDEERRAMTAQTAQHISMESDESGWELVVESTGAAEREFGFVKIERFNVHGLASSGELRASLTRMIAMLDDEERG